MKLVFQSFIVLLSSACVSSQSLAFSGIDGPTNPCFNSTNDFKYCPGPPFAYTFSWSAQGADIEDRGSGSNCYYSRVKVSTQPATITFHSTDQNGTRPDVNQYVLPKKCV